MSGQKKTPVAPARAPGLDNRYASAAFVQNPITQYRPAPSFDMRCAALQAKKLRSLFGIAKAQAATVAALHYGEADQ